MEPEETIQEDRDKPEALGRIEVLASPTHDPAEILRRIQAGGAIGAAHLFDHVGGLVNQVVWRLLGADPEHDDVVHLVFCKILEGVSGLRDPAALPAFARSVAANVVCSEIRKRSIRRLFTSAVQDVERFSSCTDDHEARQTLASVYGVMDRMPAQERVALALRWFDQCSVQEAADACGCSEATMKRRLRKATQRFRTLAMRDRHLAERMSELPNSEDT